MHGKGAELEELVRTYFDRQGFFALRGISYRYDGEEVTDIDVWLYGRQSASVRTRAVVDVKNKRSPKAFERILWIRGMQIALGCDRAIVATTDRNTKLTTFANQQKVALLTKEFLSRLQSKLDSRTRMTLEQFGENIGKYEEQKHDGDWQRRISESKSALISFRGYAAFNKCVSEFGFFAERAETRPHQREQAVRAAYFTASLACVALDSALERIVYDDQRSRSQSIMEGVTYGDSGDGRARKSVDTVLRIIADGMEGGRAVARHVGDVLNGMFASVRSDMIAEYFAKEANAATLVEVARELDDRAHRLDPKEIQTLGVAAKSVVGVLSDYMNASRSALLSGEIASSPEDRESSTAGLHTGSKRITRRDGDGDGDRGDLFSGLH